MSEEQLRQSFRDLAVERIELIEAALADHRRAARGAGDTLRRLAHALRGAGAAHGFPAVSAAAAAVAESSEPDLDARADALLASLRSATLGIPVRARTVLVVDDDEVMTTLLRATLTSSERSVAVAPTWRAAQAMIAVEAPSLIVLDLVLPDTDGRNAIIALRESAATAATPIVVVSGVLGEAPRAECRALGATEYVLKPFDPRALSKVVDDALRATASAAAGPPAAVTPARARDSLSMRALEPVLLVEDDPVVAMLVSERLRRAGLEIVHCDNGSEAIELARTRVFSCAILDIKLPGADGFAVLGAIRADARNASTPVAMLTGMGQEKDVTRGFELGADDYIVKPFSPRELAARVQRLIDRTVREA